MESLSEYEIDSKESLFLSNLCNATTQVFVMF